MNTQKSIEPKKCIICGKEFYNKVPSAKTCSKECSKQAARLKIIEAKRLKSIETYKDNPEAKTCRICGYMGLDLQPHISLGHKMSVAEYCKRFFCRPSDLSAASLHEKRSLAQKNSTNPNKRRFSSENNPAKGHGGKLSPFSKNFIGYEGLSEEEKQAKVLEVAKKANDTTNEHQNRVTKLEYYTSRGMSEEEARRALSERQTTFSLEKCIEKYGETAGKARWLERQEKWMKTLNNLPPKEKERIQRTKMTYNGYSQISQKLFKALEEKLNAAHPGLTLFYATNNPNKKNNEWFVSSDIGCFFLDFFIKEYKYAVEFDGTYWHGPERGDEEYDKIRDEKLRSLGYTVYRVSEREYRENPTACVDKIVNNISAYINTLPR